MTRAALAAVAAGLAGQTRVPRADAGRAADVGACPVPSRGQQPVGLRLALAFVAVAVLAVALVAVLAVLFSGKDIAVLVQQRRDDLTRSLAADAVSTYETGKTGWFNPKFPPVISASGR